MACDIHVIENCDDPLQLCSIASLEKIKLSSKQWILTKGIEQKIASDVISKVDAAATNNSMLNISYHRKCYMKYTAKDKISAAVKRCNQSAEDSEQVDCNVEEIELTSKRFLRSDRTVLGSSSNILPKVCLLCRKTKYVADKITKKRKMEKLVQCETTSNCILKAVLEKNDEDILVHIRDQDLVSIEMCYHSSCYKQYTRFLWRNLRSENFQDVTIFLGHNKECHSFSNCTGALNVSTIADLSTDHEEADTRLILHASHASQVYKNVIIRCSDTDVMMIALTLGYNIKSELFILKGNVQNLTAISISNVYKTLSKSVCEALIGFHVFTGCDSISAFKGKGKMSALKLMMASNEYVFAFRQLGTAWNIEKSLFPLLEKFVCHLYGQVGFVCINTCRYNWLRLGCQSDTSLPPNHDCLQKHIMRANYQSVIHKKSLAQYIKAPSPTEHGWKFERGFLAVDWMSGEAVPAILIEQILCKCKKTKCSSGHCSCRASQIHCTELCACVGCENRDASQPELEN